MGQNINGVLPADVGYLEALDAYQQGQVLGFYNSQNEELVYAGDAQLDRIEQFVLAHELTHAIDDQHFDLDRLDDMVVRCEDEPFHGGAWHRGGERQPFRDASTDPLRRCRRRAPSPMVDPPARCRHSSRSSKHGY